VKLTKDQPPERRGRPLLFDEGAAERVQTKTVRQVVDGGWDHPVVNPSGKRPKRRPRPVALYTGPNTTRGRKRKKR
jgi:hypothetical protein